jgi:structural maintenance of chromosome 3 (chondroitin sulfate proteoglycan 6)
LKPEEKKQLLHEGTGSIVVSGYVEIIFDNSDNRIPIEREEVSLRRVIGPKKDTYYLDKKLVTKSDVMNLLEGAGFSRSNPYYIVKQGKINQLAVAPDAHRLKLLREVAGTRVYDERKEESTTILKETEAKQLKISEMLSYIEERLSTLEEEKEELRAYQDLDKMRRSLEYTIHDKEMRNIREKLEKLEETRSGSNQGSKQLHDEISNAQSKIESLEREIRDANSRLSNVLVEKDQLQDDQQDLIKQRAQMEFSVKDLEQSVVEDESKKESYTNELELLKKDIDSKEDQLKVILPKFQYQKDQEERLSARLKACEQHRSELFAKQGRVQQFSSTQERDRWINSEITSLQQSVAHKEQQIHQFEQDIIHLQDKVKQQEHDLQEKTDNFEETKVALDKLNRDHARLKIQRDELANERQYGVNLILWDFIYFKGSMAQPEHAGEF